MGQTVIDDWNWSNLGSGLQRVIKLADEAREEAIQEFKDDKLDMDAGLLDRLAELLRENPERDPAACKNLSDMIWREVGIA